MMKPFYVSIIYEIPGGKIGPHLGNHPLAKIVDGAYYPMTSTVAGEEYDERVVWVGDMAGSEP